ncbi:hypothetical protein D9757_001263 [Collybiopsis confluens]|uniref:BTB domain-containing protein n=1 Tax=Collybiopsis confluens TaxID=2823264 RepID=A0A8H5MGP8_9AGAR|nr:hypothetical protein D9757_001263 [Collybiopsis confluens]
MPESTNITSSTSQLFNAPDADIVFKSFDGVLFKLHKRDIESNTGGFPPADAPSDPNEIVPLGREIGNTRNALSSNLSSAFQVADAAEKYQAFWMIQACRRECYDLIPSSKDSHVQRTSRGGVKLRRIKLLQLAIKHNDSEFMQTPLARLLLDVAPSELVDVMPDRRFKQWVFFFSLR